MKRLRRLKMDSQILTKEINLRMARGRSVGRNKIYVGVFNSKREGGRKGKGFNFGEGRREKPVLEEDERDKRMVQPETPTQNGEQGGISNLYRAEKEERSKLLGGKRIRYWRGGSSTKRVEGHGGGERGDVGRWREGGRMK